MPRVVHFEIHAADPGRAIAFYEQLFGWSFKQWEGPMEYWLVLTGPDEEPGINGGLLRRRGPIDGQAVIAFVCTIDVQDVDAAASRAVALGGQIAVPKMAIPGVGWLIYLKDPEGNLLGIMHTDPDAA